MLSALDGLSGRALELLQDSLPQVQRSGVASISSSNPLPDLFAMLEAVKHRIADLQFVTRELDSRST